MKENETNLVRLHAFLAAAGVDSRRHCEELIRQGRITVEGAVAKLGQKIRGDEKIEIDHHRIEISSMKKFRYIVLNKPKGYLSSMSDPLDRPCAIQLIADAASEHLYNVGRLDQWSSGLLLFTNDGDLASKLIHPSSNIEKEYLVHTDAPFPEGFKTSFLRGVSHEGIRYRAQSIHQIAPDKALIVLVEGKNREIRRVLEHFGLRAMLLERIRIGPIQDRNLAPGQWRDLAQEELNALKSMVNVAGRENP